MPCCIRSILCFLSIFILLACSDDQNEKASAIPVHTVVDHYIETGDIKAILARGKLRILVPRQSDVRLPREAYPIDLEQELTASFARSLNLQPELVYVDSFGQLIPYLLAGKGDVIAANFTVTRKRKEIVAFTVPVIQSREQLVSRSGAAKIKNISDLKNKTIAVQKNTSYVETLDAILKKHPQINKQVLSDNLSTDEVIDLLASKKIDFSILDSNLLESASEYRNDFSVMLDVTDERAISLALRQDNPELLDEINRYLNQQALTTQSRNIHLDDFDGIQKRKTLRVLTRNNAASYFLWRGELLGFEYELIKAFAKKHKLRLEVVVAPSHKDLIPMLKEGKGDVIASFMTVTDERKAQGIKFSRHHHMVSEIIVTRHDDVSLKKIEDLKGRSIYVRRSSAYWQTLEKLKSQGIDFNLKVVPETMETEEVIEKVAQGKYDLTLADSHILDIELTWRDDIKAAFPVGGPIKNAWAVRKKDSQLLIAINQFIKKEYKGLFYNVTYKKYFKNSHKIIRHKRERIDLSVDGVISPYDEIVKKYAEQYGFDWRLIVSQMYQESHFNPQAKSWVGAKGLMQVMPRTAKELKLTNLEDPETGIHAGIKYMKWVRERFELELDVKDRMWFTLAAYNAGQGHIKDARRLARQKGWNPNRWFNHVEKALLLLSKPKYAKQARHGYVRGHEPVKYVQQIKNRYEAYVLMGSD